jgi:2,3,4,5-tetrahydropyridine-2-carboxylate N-succinyltransferase
MKDIIESAFEDRNHLTPATASPEIKDAVNEAIHLLDSGKARVAEQKGVGDWAS